jgi:hypothetical protein
MAADINALAQALTDLAAADPPAIDLNALQAQCLAKILAGGGEVAFVVGASQNGKSGNQECRLDASELLVIVNRALSTPPNDSSGQVVGITYADFSDVNLNGYYGWS